MNDHEILMYLKRLGRVFNEGANIIASMAVDFRADVTETNNDYKITLSDKAKKKKDQQ